VVFYRCGWQAWWQVGKWDKVGRGTITAMTATRPRLKQTATPKKETELVPEFSLIGNSQSPRGSGRARRPHPSPPTSREIFRCGVQFALVAYSVQLHCHCHFHCHCRTHMEGFACHADFASSTRRSIRLRGTLASAPKAHLKYGTLRSLPND
jgi:hypothetical protein